MRHLPDPPAGDGDDKPSKSALKRAMHELQDLGEALLELPDEQLDELGMDERLRDALHELRRISAHSARKRQVQYVGKLLRGVDLEPFQRALAAWRGGQARGAAALRDVERWRDRLLAGDEGLQAWIAEHPANDTPGFRALVRDAQRDRAPELRSDSGRSNSGRSNSGAFRELFRTIKAALDSATAKTGFPPARE